MAYFLDLRMRSQAIEYLDKYGARFATVEDFDSLSEEQIDLL